MKSRFRYLLKKSNKTLQQIASEAGYTVDYVYRLKRDGAKERFNEDTIYAFAKVLNLYPSELLPLEWQKPRDIDFKILEESISYGINLAKHFTSKELNPEKIAHVIITEYIEREAKSRQNTNLHQNNS